MNVFDLSSDGRGSVATRNGYTYSVWQQECLCHIDLWIYLNNLRALLPCHERQMQPRLQALHDKTSGEQNKQRTRTCRAKPILQPLRRHSAGAQSALSSFRFGRQETTTCYGASQKLSLDDLHEDVVRLVADVRRRQPRRRHRTGNIRRRRRNADPAASTAAEDGSGKPPPPTPKLESGVSHGFAGTNSSGCQGVRGVRGARPPPGGDDGRVGGRKMGMVQSPIWVRRG